MTTHETSTTYIHKENINNLNQILLQSSKPEKPKPKTTTPRATNPPDTPPKPQEQKQNFDYCDVPLNQFDPMDDDPIDFDHVSEDVEQMSTDVMDEISLSEENEANEYCGFLRIPSTEKAIDKVGRNELLMNWVENKILQVDAESVFQYEKLTFEINKVNRSLAKSLECLFEDYLEEDMISEVTEEEVDFCRRFFNQMVNVVLNVAVNLASLRNEKVMVNDVIEAFKSLGRNVYYSDDMVDDDEQDSKDEYFFEIEIITILINNMKNEIEFPQGVYNIFHTVFEDMMALLVEQASRFLIEYSNATPLDALRIVYQMWKRSPFADCSSLIQKIDL